VCKTVRGSAYSREILGGQQFNTRTNTTNTAEIANAIKTCSGASAGDWQRHSSTHQPNMELGLVVVFKQYV